MTVIACQMYDCIENNGGFCDMGSIDVDDTKTCTDYEYFGGV